MGLFGKIATLAAIGLPAKAIAASRAKTTSATSSTPPPPPPPAGGRGVPCACAGTARMKRPGNILQKSHFALFNYFGEIGRVKNIRAVLLVFQKSLAPFQLNKFPHHPSTSLIYALQWRDLGHK